MELGTYDGKAIDFDEFSVEVFRPFIRSDIKYRICGCGASALALLTGEDTTTIRQPNKRGDWTYRYMNSYLKRHGFRVAKLTMKNLTNLSIGHYPIGRSHVILASVKFMKGEATWIVIYNKIMFHNYEVTSLNEYELINHPIMAAYIVKHKNWA